MIAKRNIILLVVTAVVAIATAYILLKDRKDSTLSDREADFSIRTPEKISKIELQDEQKRKIILHKRSGKWIVNERYEARPALVENLIHILSAMESQSPVGKNAVENVMREMMQKHVYVKVFTGSYKPHKVFYVGGATPDSRKTYMLLEIDGELASRPHMVRVPGMEGYLTPYFEMDEEVWRSRKVFNIPLPEMKEVSVVYPGSPARSFTITVFKDSFILKNAFGEVEKANSSILYTYCSMFEDLHFEAFDNDNPERESVVKDQPFAIIKLKNIKDDSTVVKLYFMPVNRRSKRLFDEQGNEVLVDVDRLYATLNDKDFALAQMYVFGKVLRNYQDFFPIKKP
ncbi:MAG: hypothetical protein RMJ53_04660 [Chitinophagales bacterium]|nr:DUF4340 domain-containing protein [Chitinophagales bacterium]MDW8273505.1 hypothetical protein [Chitinophagales bacterium]